MRAHRQLASTRVYVRVSQFEHRELLIVLCLRSSAKLPSPYAPVFVQVQQLAYVHSLLRPSSALIAFRRHPRAHPLLCVPASLLSVHKSSPAFTSFRRCVPTALSLRQSTYCSARALLHSRSARACSSASDKRRRSRPFSLHASPDHPQRTSV